MNTNRRLALISLTLILVFSTMMIGCSSSNNTEEKDDVINIKIAHTDSDTRSTHIWSVWLGEYLEEKAPGQFVVEVYPDGKLGDTSELIEEMAQNNSEKGLVIFDLSSVVSSSAGPEAACIDLPYLYPTYEDWVIGTFENGGLELFRDSLKGYGFYCIDMYYNGMRQVISRVGPFNNLDAIKGQKIRISRNLINIEIWNALGAFPAPMPWGEVISTMKNGQIDALDHSLGVFNDFNFHEFAPYITLTNHASSPFPIVTSLEWIESLDPELREIFEEGVHEMARQQREEERKLEDDYLIRFQNEGATVTELSEEEVAVFSEAVQPVYDMWRELVGSKIVDEWLGTVPK